MMTLFEISTACLKPEVTLLLLGQLLVILTKAQPLVV